MEFVVSGVRMCACACVWSTKCDSKREMDPGSPGAFILTNLGIRAIIFSRRPSASFWVWKEKIIHKCTRVKKQMNVVDGDVMT